MVARRCTLARLAFFAFIGFAFLAFTRLVAFLVTRAFRKLVLALLVAFVALTGLAFSRLAFTRLAFFLFAMSCLLQSLLIIDTDTRKSERLPPTSSHRSRGEVGLLRLVGYLGVTEAAPVGHEDHERALRVP